jgi:hypothetical protein
LTGVSGGLTGRSTVDIFTLMGSNDAMGVRRIRGGLAVLGAVALVGGGVAVATRLTAGPSVAVMQPLVSPVADGSAPAGEPATPPPCGPGTRAGSPPPAIAVPDQLMLTPADVNGAPVVVLAAEVLRPARLFKPSHCRDGYPSDAYRAGERAVSADVADVDGESTWHGVAQYVAVYHGDGAGNAMADLRGTVTAPPDPTRCWTDLGPAGAGDESIMLTCVRTVGYAGELVEEQFAAVVRVGRAIVMVIGMVTGRQPDNGSAHARVRALAHAAADRLRAIA